MYGKAKRTKNQIKVGDFALNLFLHEELVKKADVIMNDLASFTWWNLVTKGKFAKKDKVTFNSDDKLMIGGDIGSETHYVRAINSRRRKLRGNTFPFSNHAEGLQNAKSWTIELA